ncbi:MAG: DNA repair protein RecO [Gammaproteobacteria bacterium]
MSELRQVYLAPAWLLHRYPYRETSLILELLSRDHGRIGLVARGARAPRRGKLVFGPFEPLLVSFRRRGELGTLLEAESAGSAYGFNGKSFLAACYLNELVLRLLPRDDPSPDVYAIYTETLAALAPEPAPGVRRFEGRLLRMLGWVPPLGRDGSGATLIPTRRYRYDPQLGPVSVNEKDGWTGDMFAAIAAERFDDPLVLATAGRIFRDIIAYHLGGRRLKSLDIARAVTRSNQRRVES